MTFGAVKGGRSRAKSFRLRNVGDADLRVDAIDVTPMPPFELVGPQPPFTVAPGEEVEVTLRFTPTEKGKVQGTGVIHSNDPDEPAVELPLKGKGKKQR